MHGIKILKGVWDIMMLCLRLYVLKGFNMSYEQLGINALLNKLLLRRWWQQP